MKVLKRTVHTVYPESPTDFKTLFLSGADHFVRPRHIPLTLYYTALDDGREIMPTRLSLESLSKLLVHFYPLAGRLRQRDFGKLELVCNDAGAEFVEVTVDGTLVDYLQDLQPNRLLASLVNPVPALVGDAIFEHPVCYCQVTRFACGGAAVVSSIIHSVTDGLSVSRFLTAWSEVARGVELSITPFHDRTLLKSKGVPDQDFHPPELRAVPSIAAIAVSTSALPAERLFIFSLSQLKKLKSIASSEKAEYNFSTFESLNAHIWRSVTKARGLDASKITKYLTTLDVRTRLKPNLPEGFFGNAISFVAATLNVGDMLEKPLSFTACSIRNAISGFSDSYMRSVLAFAEYSKGPVVMNVNGGESAGHDVSAATWGRMGFYSVDFGFGKPVFCSPGSNPYDGSVIIMPSHVGDGAFNVFIALKTEHMERLISDPSFFFES